VQVNSGSSNVIVYNNCYAPGIYLNGVGQSNMILYNLVMTTGTSGSLQNPLQRLYGAAYPNLAMTGLYNYGNVYCLQTYSTSSYMWQLQKSTGTWRYNFFQDWVNSATGDAPYWEYQSAAYYMCDTRRTIFQYQANAAMGLLVDTAPPQFNNDDKKEKLASIMAPVLTCSVVLIAIIVAIVAVRKYRANKNASEDQFPPEKAGVELSINTSMSSSSSSLELGSVTLVSPSQTHVPFHSLEC